VRTMKLKPMEERVSERGLPRARRPRRRGWLSSFAAGFSLAGGLTVLALRSRRRPRFTGQSVVITGGSRGLGLVLAREFAAEGARLTLLARDPDELARAEAELADRGAEVLAISCDVRDQSAVQDAVERVVEHYGGIDVLVNNAGIIQVGPLDHMRLEDFAEALAVHAWGPLYTTLAALPHMRRQGGGRLVNISSIGGKVAPPHLLPYVTSKFALTGLSEGLRAELTHEHISVTTVIPGLMRTGSHVNAWFKGHHRGEYTWFTLLDALPITSFSARRAARQIVEATRRGAARIIITPQARLAVLADTLFPGVMARAMQVVNWLLPPPTPGATADQWSGWESWTAWAPSLLTRLADQAVEETNSLRGHAPIV
jgi:NAD(P)-dependent dehydrogenase (short-subunit alcohol dehydrogenase family)